MITLETLKDATKQQIFDQVSKHMLEQKQRSVKVNDSSGDAAFCSYRGTGGLKCAAGCLIADSEYTPEMDSALKNPPPGVSEGTNWGNLVRRGLVPLTDHTDFIARLQTIHDGDEPEDWAESLNIFAKHYGLTPVV